MGNEIGSLPSKMGITSLAVTTPNIEMPAFEKLLASFKKVAAERGHDKIHRDDFMASLKQLEKFTPSDSELFVQLFTLFDDEGHDTVDYKNYMAGCSLVFLSIPNVEKMKFALSIYDVKGTKCSLRGDVKRLLMAVNQTAAFFGDPVLAASEIELIMIDLFNDVKNQTIAGIPQDEAASYLLQHRLVYKFMSGQGTVRFGGAELNA
jgi:Ca2+-binding EF-hand superfamily protein